jgi:hypothetical protein
MSLDPELEQFKRIDLREYAASQGYELDKKESWSGSAVMRRRLDDDKIVIKLGPDGHYVYFSVRDERDNGSIIDFEAWRSGTRGGRLHLGLIRKKLRLYSGRPALAIPQFKKMEVTGKDREAVEKAYHRMRIAVRHPYLEDVRGIPAAILASQRFAGRIRIDVYSNAVFPHYDAGGLAGYEMKNRNFTGFAKGGEKGLWTSHSHEKDHRLVFAESAIDALSYATLFPVKGTRYASIGGKLNPQQPALIHSEIAKLQNEAEVIAAMDNDEDGRKLAAAIEAAVAQSGRKDLRYSPHFPPLKDWNDVLRSK